MPYRGIEKPHPLAVLVSCGLSYPRRAVLLPHPAYSPPLFPLPSAAPYKCVAAHMSLQHGACSEPSNSNVVAREYGAPDGARSPRPPPPSPRYRGSSGSYVRRRLPPSKDETYLKLRQGEGRRRSRPLVGKGRGGCQGRTSIGSETDANRTGEAKDGVMRGEAGCMACGVRRGGAIHPIESG